MTIAIRVANLGKRYRIGVREQGNKTLREAIVGAVGAPVRNLSRLRSLTKFGDENGDGPAADTIWALKDVRFDVKEGEVVGIIGANGAGKSTLLKILSRITEPTAGFVQVKGRVSSLLEVGTGFHPELTGRENVYLNAAVLGMRKKEIERKFDEIVDFSGVEKFIDTPVKRYSSGMQLRLAFAVGAHMEPEILIIDEVLAVGDAQFQKKCLGKMSDLNAEGRTVLFVSHDMPAITRLCSRALLLENGHLIKDGPSSEIVSGYLSRLSQTNSAKVWPLDQAPGTDALKLESVELMREGDPSAALVSVEDQLEIRVGYQVNAAKLRFRCAVLLYTQGSCAFVSVEPREEERARPGRYYSSVTIPPNLLGENEYTVSLSIFASRGAKSHFVQEKDVIAFQVVDPMKGDSARGDYAENLIGLVRPRLAWQINFRDPDAGAVRDDR